MAEGGEKPNEWESAELKEGFVTEQTPRTFLHTRGPARKPGDVVVIFESGGGSCSAFWSSTARLLAPKVRSYYYDRAGIGKSEASDLPRTAGNAADELLSLLDKVGVRPPWIVVGHSHGGVIAREFLARAPTDAVVGMVFVDANTEHTHVRLQTPFATLGEIMKGLDFAEITKMKERHKYTSEELQAIMADSALDIGTGDAEVALIPESAKALANRKQFETQALGLGPVTVIRGDNSREIRQVLDAAHAAGKGTSEQRAEAEAFFERFQKYDEESQKEQLKLTKGNARFVQAKGSGHVVHAFEPELIADEILSMVRAVQPA